MTHDCPDNRGISGLHHTICGKDPVLLLLQGVTRSCRSYLSSTPTQTLPHVKSSSSISSVSNELIETTLCGRPLRQIQPSGMVHRPV